MFNYYSRITLTMAFTSIVRVLRPVIFIQLCISIAHAQELGALAAGTMMGRSSPILSQAVREIVHPLAQPSPQMRAIASRSGGPPATVADVMQYTPHMTQLARQFGVKPPGTIGNPTEQALYQYMLQRGTQWLQRRSGSGGMGGMGNMMMMNMLMGNA